MFAQAVFLGLLNAHFIIIVVVKHFISHIEWLQKHILLKVYVYLENELSRIYCDLQVYNITVNY